MKKASRKKNTQSEATKYRRRDAHEILLRPKAKSKPKKKSADAKATAKTKKGKKREQWTDKQRRTWALAHHIYNHGTATEAKKFLQSDNNRRNISDEWRKKLELKSKTTHNANAAASAPEANT